MGKTVQLTFVDFHKTVCVCVCLCVSTCVCVCVYLCGYGKIEVERADTWNQQEIHKKAMIHSSYIWMSHVAHMNESCPTYEWVMSHICMSHVTHVKIAMIHSSYADWSKKFTTDFCGFRHVEFFVPERADWERIARVCIYVYAFLCTHVYIYTHNMHLYSVFMCMRMCMYVYVHIRIHINTLNHTAYTRYAYICA